MTTTALMPLDPALSLQRLGRILTISANLLPEEIVAARRARRSRSWVLAVLALVVLLLGGWYLRAYNDRSDASKELDSVAAQTMTAQRSQSPYQKVVKVRSETDNLTKELKILLAKDLQYAALLDSLRTTGTATGVTVTGVTAALSVDDGNAAPGPALPSDTTAAAIGTLVITGTAPDKPSVAAYADKLRTLGTVANPYVSSVTTAKTGAVSFSLSADITSMATCGRFADPCKTTGGK
jgi:hypothetical protein